MKAGHYEMGLSPLALVWKDGNTSRFFVNSAKPSVVLRLDGEKEFVTLEGIVLFTSDQAFIQQHEVRFILFRFRCAYDNSHLCVCNICS